MGPKMSLWSGVVLIVNLKWETQFCEDGEFNSVHTWQNDCGHVAKYTDLKEIVVSKE